MKKFSIITLVTSLILSMSCASMANAKTQGHYIGIDAIGSKLKFYERNSKTYSPQQQNSKPSYSRFGFGGGLNYKYAFNFSGLFIAPGIFAEQNNVSANGRGDNYLYRLDIKNRYGLKADIGYDITNKIAPYFTGGYSKVSYRTRNFWTDSSTITTIENSVVGDWYYGAGLKINYNKNINFNIEYNRQSFLAKTLLGGNSSTYEYVSKFKSNLDILKLGVSYNF